MDNPYHSESVIFLLPSQLYYTPDTLDTYLGLNYDERVDPAKNDGTKPDNVMKVLAEYIPQGLFICLFFVLFSV